MFFCRINGKCQVSTILLFLLCGLASSTHASEVVGWGGQKLPNEPLTNLTHIAAGGGHSLALKSGGSIVGWGRNNSGQAIPPADSDFAAIAAGDYHSLALKYDGSIVGWGSNGYGQATPPTGSDFVAIAAGGYHSLVLKDDGSIVGLGWNNYGQATPPDSNDFVAIDAGKLHSIALKSDGSIVGWGRNTYGQATPPTGSDFVAIATGREHGLALKSDGSIVGWGSHWSGQTSTPAGNDFVAIAAGSLHGLALKTDGSIVGWGANNYGQATPPAGSDFVAITAGASYSLALRSDGSIVGWGHNRFGQTTPPAGNDYVAITVGTDHDLAQLAHGLALKSDGSIVGWGRNNSGQATPPAGNDYVAIAAGDEYSLALKSDGSIVGWGNNVFDKATPPAGSDYVAIATGDHHSLALKSDGSVVGWGSNNYGQAAPPAGSDYVAIAAGGYHSLALKYDGSIVGWGNDVYEQNIPPVGNDFVAIAAGWFHSLALKSDGSIAGWGYNNYGQTTPPAGSDYVAIAAGGYHSLALKYDGSIVGWGYNHPSYAQATPPPGNDFVAVAAGGDNSLALRGGELITAFKLRFLSSTHAGNVGFASIDVIGSGFKEGATIKLVKGAVELFPTNVIFSSLWKLKTIFDFTSASPGIYEAVITNPDGSSITLSDAFEIVEGGQPELWAKLTVPPLFRPGRKYTAYVEYGNEGDVEMNMPVFNLSNSTGASMRISQNGRMSENNLLLLGVSKEDKTSTLLPGEKATINIEFESTDDVEFTLTVLASEDELFDWELFKPVFRPPLIDDAQYDTEYTQIIEDMGNTWGEVLDKLALILDEMPTKTVLASDMASMLKLTMSFANILPTIPSDTPDDFIPEQDVNVLGLETFDPDKDCTYIITHGMNKSANSDEFPVMAQRITSHCSECNVLRVDWEKGAESLLPWGAAGNIRATAEETLTKIKNEIGANNFNNINWSNTTFIGHSYGNQVNAAIAEGVGKKGMAIILDAANPGGSWGTSAPGIDFANYFEYSLAVSSGSWGDAGPCWPYPRRIAHNQLYYPTGPGKEAHGAALRIFTEQISGTNCDNDWLKGTFSLPQSPAGWYDGFMGEDGIPYGSPFYVCVQIPGTPFSVGNILAYVISTVIRSIDPNEKKGKTGFDPNDTPYELLQRFVPHGEPLTYDIYFENLPAATAPAQEVRIYDYLSPSLDWSSLELGEIVFGDQVVTTFAGKVSGQDTVPLEGSEYELDISSELNIYTGRLSWVLRMIDPNTGDLPIDPLAGFLPPNDPNTHCGEGHVSFIIYPQADLFDARVTNKATIFFDTEEPIDCNEWVNTVDGFPPESTVSPLAGQTVPPMFEVSWSGDDGQGSGVSGYDVYVAMNDGPYTAWLLNTSETSKTFVGQPAYHYRFYSTASDFMGNVEPTPTTPDAETVVGPIDLSFFAEFATHWLEIDCNEPQWCDGMDFNNSGEVYPEDLATLGTSWLLDCSTDPNDPSCLP